jgi:hypothetical protein
MPADRLVSSRFSSWCKPGLDSLCWRAFIGWVPAILKIGNWDQVLFLSFVPFIVVRMQLVTFPNSQWRSALYLSAGVFSYPEGAAFIRSNLFASPSLEIYWRKESGQKNRECSGVWWPNLWVMSVMMLSGVSCVSTTCICIGPRVGA